MNRSNTAEQALTRAAYDALLVQVIRERDWLQAARHSLIQVRRCVMIGDLASLDASLHEQATLTEARSQLSAARTQVLQQAADQLGLCERPVTLLAIAARLPAPARRPLLSARRELLGNARHVQALAGSALSTFSQTRQLLDGVLGDLFGTSPTESRYSADGQRREPAGPALVECRT